MTALTAHGVSVGHGRRIVVSDVDLHLSPGTATAVVGANGSGKSTLLRSLAGATRPASGVVRLDDTSLVDLRAKHLARQIAFLPQAPLVPSGISVRELVTLGRHPHRSLLAALDATDHEAVADALHRAGLEGFDDRPVEELSGGERQRVWIAVALAQQAPVLLLDEPTSFLDIRHQLEVMALLRRLCDEDARTVVAVLHDLNQAAAFADELVVVGDGRILAQGPPAEVLTAETVAVAFGVDAEVVIGADGRPSCRFHGPADPHPNPNPTP